MPLSGTIIGALCVLLVFPIHIFADAVDYEGKTIVAIQYDPLEQPLAEADLKQIQILKPGAPLKLFEVSDAIDRFYATGRYADIQVEAESSGDGVIVRFVMKLNLFVGRVEAEGNVSDPPSRGQLAAATQLNLGQPFKDDQLTKAEANLKHLLESNGLYEATVHSRVDRGLVAQQVNIRFAVESGKRARLQPPVLKGDLKLPEKMIAKATGWKYPLINRWKLVTQTRVRKGLEGIQRKYQSKDRLMASVLVESLEYDPKTRRVKPTLNISAGPKVTVKAVETKVSQSKLKKYVPIFSERSVDRDLLVEGARNLRDYFQSEGYYDVQVDFREAPVTNKDEMVIEYVISRGERHKLVKIEIEGNKYFDSDTIRERMILQPSSFQFRHGRYSEIFRKRDEENIANLYKSNGFQDVKVTGTLSDDYKGKTGQMAITFHIDEGMQWRVADLDVEGISQLNANTVTAALSSVEGQPYSETSVASDRSHILTQYFSSGFPNAQFEWSSKPDPDAGEVKINYTITEGSRLFVRDVLIDGLHSTKDRLVNRHLLLKAGDPLSPVEVTAGQRRLYNLGVFAKVDTAIQNPEGETQHKYVLYQIYEANRYTINFGGGAEIARIGGTSNDLTTPAGATGFSPRATFDITRMNAFGLGHTVSFRGRVSSLQKRGILTYLAPRYRNVEGRNLTFSLVHDDSRDVRTFASKRDELSAQISQQLSKPTTALFRFAYRRVSTSNVVIPALLVPQLLQPVRIGILSANLIQDRRDNPADARKGIYNTVDLGLASRIFGSQRSFVRGLVKNATYHPIGKKLVLAREVTFGSVLPFSAPAGLERNDSVPLPERFFGGGGISHRGFPENQAGPRDIGTPAGPGGIASQATGFPLGGNALLFHQTELRFPLLGDNIGGVLFHDAGNIYRGIGDISFRTKQKDAQDFNYMVHAAGFGVRYKTPVGPIRLDLAYSINPPKYVGFAGTIQDLLLCRTACVGVQQRISHLQFFFSIGQTF